MKLWQYSGKHIKITTNEGKIFYGVAQDYVSGLDNPNGVACISIAILSLKKTKSQALSMQSQPSMNLQNQFKGFVT